MEKEKLTPGKLAGLKAVSDHRGVIAAAAMDQRGSLQKALAKERGAAADAHDLEVFKTLVTSVLTKHASAILLDPEYGLPASKHRNGKGLLLAYEQDGKPLTRKQATRDTRFRNPSQSAGAEGSYLVVDSARMYFLVDNHDFGQHELELHCSTGIAAFAFTFTSCVDPVASALQASATPGL